MALTANDPMHQLQGIASGTAVGGATVTVNVQMASLAAPPTTQGIITTVAGSIFVFHGGGGPATNATLGFVQSAATDTSGNVYIADPSNHMVTKVSTTGILTILAGTGTAGFSGDGEPAVSALLNSPQAVAVDSAGNVFIADTGNQRIRKIDGAGRISTVAGNGVAGFAGDGGPAILASIWNPRGVAVDAFGNLYISDASNQRIRKVDAAGTITTFAGDEFKDVNGQGRFAGDNGPAVNASLSGPQELALDTQGNLYIADAVNGRIRKVAVNGIITTYAGGGACCALTTFAGVGGSQTKVWKAESSL